MTVAITKGLKEIEDGLRQIGYEVVRYGNYNLPIDAVVYSGASIASSQMSNANFGNATGILMINATNKSVSEIDNCLKRKTYSPLF